MGTIRVVVTELAFFGGSRRRPGAVLELDESILKRDADGKVVLPKWCLPDTPDNRAFAAGVKKRDEDRVLEGAIASASPVAKIEIGRSTPFGRTE